MPSHPITLEHKQFTSKHEATQFFKSMLERYNDGDTISSEEDDNLLFDLIQRHPEVNEKIGVGVECFFRDISPNFPTSCFHIKRKDGTTTDISYPTCIKSASPTVFQDFYSACRFSVSEKLIEEKRQIFSSAEVLCSITGEILSIDNSEYRHTRPAFRDIVNDFILSENLEVTADMIEENADMQYATRFANQTLTDKFNAFHSSRANLEIVKKFQRR